MASRIYSWRFKTIPTTAQVEGFIENQMGIFARYTAYLCGADGRPIVDTMKVEHNNGAVNMEFQLNGIPGHAGDVFCFPGYYPGDKDEIGSPLYNTCDTHGYFYGKIVGMILHRAQGFFNMEYTTSDTKAKQYQIN